MTEFEKWKRGWVCDILTCSSMKCDDCKVLLQRGWKSALEWVLSIDSGFCKCGVPNDSVENKAVLFQIEEELKNLNKGNSQGDDG